MNKQEVAYSLNAILILILSFILMSAFFVQFLLHEVPCPLCMLQRLAMIGVGIGALFNLQYGIVPLHYGLSLFSAMFGGIVSVRQILLHLCPGFSPPMYPPFLGLQLYTWALLTFLCTGLLIIVCLFLYQPQEKPFKSYRQHTLSTIALYVIGFVTLANFLTTAFQCGLGICD